MLDQIFAPDPQLAHLIHCPKLTTLPGGDYLLPAGLQPLLLVILGGRIELRDGPQPLPLPSLTLCGSSRSACAGWSAPGTRILTLSIRAGRLAELFGLEACQISGTMVALSDLLEGAVRGELHALEERIAAAPSPGVALAQVELLLVALHRRLTAARRALTIPLALIELPLAELADRFGLGERQFERRFTAQYGQPLRGYRQQLRLSRTLARFVAGRSELESWAAIAAAGGYSDQAHLTRDFVRFTGHTPGALLRGLRSGDPAMWPYRFDQESLTRMFGPGGY